MLVCVRVHECMCVWVDRLGVNCMRAMFSFFFSPCVTASSLSLFARVSTPTKYIEEHEWGAAPGHDENAEGHAEEQPGDVQADYGEQPRHGKYESRAGVWVGVCARCVCRS